MSGHAETPHLERANAAEVEVSRLKALVQRQADRIAWLEGDVAGWRIKLAAERGEHLAENELLRDALERITQTPYRDWHLNAQIARAALDETPSEDA